MKWLILILGHRLQRLRQRPDQDSDAAATVPIAARSGGGSLAPESLETGHVRGLLLKTGPGKLSAQLRCAYAFALDHGYQGQGYQGIVTIDGNDKDDPEAIPRFIDALKQGLDVVQASRWTLFRLSLRASRSV